MTKRRSPNYPAISFPEALEKAHAIYDKAQRHKTDKESLAQILGYNGLNGKSLGLLASLNAYGLLKGTKHEAGITEEGEIILVDPETSETRYETLLDCAYRPQIYLDVLNRYNFDLPSDEILRPYLLKKSYSSSAANSIIHNIRETVKYVQDIELTVINSRRRNEDAKQEIKSKQDMINQPTTRTIQSNSNEIVAVVDERELFSYDFEPSGKLRLLISSGVDTIEALEILTDLVELKKRELERKAKQEPTLEEDQ